MSFDEITRLAQQRGFFFKSADSYPNSPAGFWDYGPLGVSMRNKFVELWRRSIVKRDGMLEIDGAQILPKRVFEASGHLTSFTDPFVRCSKCGSVYRPDKLIEEKTHKPVPEKLSDQEYDSMMEATEARCQRCGSHLSGTARFNMMFGLGIGPAEEQAFLRPETCQSIFVDFPLLFKTQRVKLPVGVAQAGRSFRNEIAPRQGLLRLRELNQAEVEVFFNPKNTDDPRFKEAQYAELSLTTPDGASHYGTVSQAIKSGLIPNPLVGYYLFLLSRFYQAAGLPMGKTRFRILSDKDRAFYSKAAYDFEVELSVGWVELVACNYRGDYDLTRHADISGTDFTVEDDGAKVLPHIFELSLGIDRSLYALLETSMQGEGERRRLTLRPYLAPRLAGIFPLVNKDGLEEAASSVYDDLKDAFDIFYDRSGSIGRRYARADEIGVPYCITIDHDTMRDQTVTLRDRDTREQKRIAVSSIGGVLAAASAYPKR